MSKVVKRLGIAAGVIAGIVLLLVLLFVIKFPDVTDAPAIVVDRTPERIARGAYLANHVTVCIDCHSTRDWSRFSGPIVPGTEGKGGVEFNKDIGGVPGRIFSSNITPAGIKELL